MDPQLGPALFASGKSKVVCLSCSDAQLTLRREILLPSAVSVVKVSDERVFVTEGGSPRAGRLYDSVTGVAILDSYKAKAMKGYRSSAWTFGISVVQAEKSEGQRIVMGGDGSFLGVYDARHPEFPLFRFRESTPSTVYAVCSEPEWPDSLFVGGSGKVANDVVCFSLVKRKLIRRLSGHTSTVHGLASCADLGTVYSGSLDSHVCVFDSRGGQCVTKAAFPQIVDSVAVCPDAHLLFVGMRIGMVAVRDVRMFGDDLRQFPVSSSTMIEKIVQVEADLFASSSAGEPGVAIWRRSGKIEDQYGKVFRGVCCVGSPYDRPPCCAAEDEDLPLRVGFILEISDKLRLSTCAIQGCGLELLLPSWYNS